MATVPAVQTRASPLWAKVIDNTRRAFQVTRCNMCDDAPCVAACPTSAMVRRAGGGRAGGEA